jgi:Ca2+-transporting ATPase
VVETLGCTSVICTDKTGTLTKDEMTVKSVITPKGEYSFTGAGFSPEGEIFHNKNVLAVIPDDLTQLLVAGCLCADADLVFADNQWQVMGDATEGAIIVAGRKAKLSKENLVSQWPRLEEIPFTSEKKYMATLHASAQNQTVYVKGAVEAVLEMCDYVYDGTGKSCKFNNQQKEKFIEQAEKSAKAGRRVIALAKNHTLKDLKATPHNLEFLGLVAMADTLRPEAKTAVAVCKNAGIRVIMITGDHPQTAKAIGLELGIITEAERVLSGKELMHVPVKELEALLKHTNIFARVSPEDKLKIVSVLQKQGEVVAMTGDGVNDAPALKQADIGVAMGIKGTDVSKESAAITLLDDNFATIVSAVEQGRIIFGNIRKYLTYLLSAHVGEVVLITLAVILGWPLPLTSVQILFVNLASDGPPALALSAEKGSLSVMLEKPRNPKAGIFNTRALVYMLVAAVWTTVLNIFIFLYFWKFTDNLKYAGTATFVSLILIQLFKAYALKNERDGFFQGLFNNPWLNLSVILQLPILWAISHMPIFQKIFSTTQLSGHTWIFIGLLAFTIVPILEITKKLLNQFWLND